MCLARRQERAEAARKGQTAVAASAPKLERLAQASAAVTQILADPALKPRKPRKAPAESGVIIPDSGVINQGKTRSAGDWTKVQ
jgi:hypothetical protein